MEKKSFYITTAIDYANAPPHLGHALEKVQADVIARYKRFSGKEVMFLTGTDEHGVKNVRAADSIGMDVKQFVEKNTKLFEKLADALDISNDSFIRTTDKKRHWPAVEKVWKELDKNGDIYKKEYEGLYCVGHEAFVTQKDLVDGKCVIHNKEPEVIREENYFFRLSKYTDKIKENITKESLRIIPEGGKNEILQLLDDGLEDVSFSRPSKDLSWGIPVPGDKTQTIYVWADALTNYISALGYGDKDHETSLLFKTFWPADVHMIGKDILRFHAAIWPGILLSLGLPLPRMLFVHGFISIGGKKMSKSTGNVVDPFVLIEKYGADALRYYLLREITPTKDGDFTWEKFNERYAGDLAKGLGNLVSRVITLASSHIDNSFKGVRTKELDDFLDERWIAYHIALEEFRFNEALRIVWELVAWGDKRVDSTKLWELPASTPERFREIISELAVLLGTIGHMIRPFLPGTANKIFEQLGVDPDSKNEWRFTMKKGEPLFPKIG